MPIDTHHKKYYNKSPDETHEGEKMLKRLAYIAHSADYTLRRKILSQKKPFIAGIVLNNSCNLQCLQCHLERSRDSNLPYEVLEEKLDEFYKEGIRSLAITGGEPFMWREKNLSLPDVLGLIYKKGFLVTSVYTNGTFPLDIPTDNIFVSLDGTRETTNKLRGDIFDLVISNIQKSSHPKIFINFTINRKNYQEIEAFCDFISHIKQVKGIYFYFHTPYYGFDDLHLPFEEKKEIAKKLIELKKRYRILNSLATLKDYINNNWERPSHVCKVLSENGVVFDCCRSINKKEACENCGYLGYLEVRNVVDLKISSVIEAFHYVPLSKKKLHKLFSKKE